MQSFSFRFVSSVLIGLGGLAASPAFGATASSGIPTADVFVSSSNSTGNYGGAGALEVSASGLPKGEFQSLMKFDTSTAKTLFDATYGVGQWSVQSISLQLTSAAPGNAIFNTSAAGSVGMSWMQNDSWAEGTGSPMAPTADGITYSTLPTFLTASDEALGTFSFAGGTTGANSYSLGLTPGILSDIGSGSLASVRVLPSDSAVSYLFNSRSFGTASARPTLTITADAVPEPTSLMLGGVIALFAAGRRRMGSR